MRGNNIQEDNYYYGGERDECFGDSSIQCQLYGFFHAVFVTWTAESLFSFDIVFGEGEVHHCPRLLLILWTRYLDQSATYRYALTYAVFQHIFITVILDLYCKIV